MTGQLKALCIKALQDEVKVGILAGSLLAGIAGWAVLRCAPRQVADAAA